MSDRIEVTSPPITPIYRQSKANERIDLGNVPVRYELDGTMHQDTVSVRITFDPNPDLRFVCPTDQKSPMFGLRTLVDADRITSIELTDRGVTIDALCVALGADYGGLVFSPTASGMMATQPSDTISTATFHLFNFPDFHGPDAYILRTGEPPWCGYHSCGRAILKADGWTIVIAATDQTRSLAKELKRGGGYVLTHVGQVTREDERTFSSKELDDILASLHYFLSFALGRWAGLALPVGFDLQGNRVFEEWGVRIMADGAWNGGLAWFDSHHGDLLSKVFPGFRALWTNPIWRQPLAHAIYWYLGACDRRVGVGVDTGLVLAQTALELLAWTHCVSDQKMVSAKAFKRGGLAAADKLRLLASSLGIPKEIPPELPALKQKKEWTDGMEAVTGIRNSLVHPGTGTELPEHSYFEGWKLSLWYIDLTLLRLCGHSGSYANRLKRRWAGQIEPVPWS
jgi:hypothetical protein